MQITIRYDVELHQYGKKEPYQKRIAAKKCCIWDKNRGKASIG